MQQYIWMAVTLLVAVAGGLLFKRLKMPAPYVVGAMLAVALFNIFTDLAFFPRIIKVGVQSIAGAYIGSGIGRSDLRNLRGVILPALLIMPCMLVVNIL